MSDPLDYMIKSYQNKFTQYSNCLGYRNFILRHSTSKISYVNLKNICQMFLKGNRLSVLKMAFCDSTCGNNVVIIIIIFHNNV